MYSNFKEQAIEYVRQAVAEDNSGNYAKAFPLYMIALQYFRTHLKYEKNPKIREAITQKFTEYLRRAEEIRAVLDDGGSGPTSNGDAARPKTKPKFPQFFTGITFVLEKLGLGLLISDTNSHDSITLTGSNSEIQHTEPSQNPLAEKSDSPALVMAAEAEDGGTTDTEAEFQLTLERDLCRLTIEQAEMESARGISEAVDVKDVEGTKNVESVEGEDQNGVGDVENEGTVKLDNLQRDGKIGESVENENENRLSYMENEGTMKLDNLHEEKDGKKGCAVNENRWGYMENEEPVKLDYVHGEKGGKNIESVENENENRWGYMEKEKSVEVDDVYDDKGGKNADSVEDENENAVGYMENAGVAATRFGRYNTQSNNNKRIRYRMRPDAEDCAFYMRSGTCKFGSNCKFNHPPRRKNQGVKERANFNEESSERARQGECKYYLSPAGCKYGTNCRFSHGSDKSFMSSHSLEFNFLGLPIRPEEKECPSYMGTGTCKYGASCRFHHPEPTTVGGTDSPSGYGVDGSIPSQHVSSSISSWSSPRALNETSSFTPVIFSQTQGAPTSESDWNSFQTATYPTSENSLPTPPAFSLNNLTEINFPMQHQHGKSRRYQVSAILDYELRIQLLEKELEKALELNDMYKSQLEMPEKPTKPKKANIRYLSLRQSYLKSVNSTWE
ncbi:hypothetical protein CASFOL_037863 [Castilleja foliolosa]|uniref:C3H1-type domain-containing protein n=1 Tax=Castilleja foliolosa TaxID=1961234 RepID=A0ABD3BJU2_9LAMI